MDPRIQQRRAKAAKFQKACDARLPIMSPLFNFREVAKQMLLLEDHLLHGSKHCLDCIRKHLMTIEAFAEEATTLDKKQSYVTTSELLAGTARRWIVRVTEDGSGYHELAQEIRVVRKELVKLVHDPRTAAQRVASVWLVRGQHNH
tara:strand:- start:1991 stop:2428 length:438 start_codon:yes stop_codon:yes gene_type:complete